MSACKVPVVIQMEALECGAASLAMILAYHGKWVALNELRIACGVSRDGVNARDILGAAKTYGLATKAYRCGAAALKNIPAPSILFWDNCHFVVYCGMNGQKIILNDPARGRVSVTHKEFEDSFSNIVLNFTPGEAFQKGGAPQSVWAFARERLRGTLPAVVVVLITSFLAAFVSIVEPVFSKVFIDTILPGARPEWTSAFLLLMGLTLIFGMVAIWLQSVYMLRIRGKFAIQSNCAFMWHVLRLPMRFYAQRYAGDLMNRQGDNAGLTESLLGVIAPLGIDALMMVLYLLIMLKYSLLLTAIGIATALLNMLAVQIVVNKTMDFMRVSMREAGKVESVTLSGIEMIETIKASGAENGFFERWSGFQASESYESNRMLKITSVCNVIPTLLAEGADMLVLILGCSLIINGSFTAGTLLAFQGFLSSFLGPVSSVLDVGSTIRGMRASMERVEDVMRYPTDEHVRTGDPSALHKLSGAVSMKDVTFGYALNQPPTIAHFNLDIKPGARVALVGASGSGKSTVASLISGLYAPWSGSVAFDGVPIGEIDHLAFTSSIAVVTQDITLFEDSVSDNIRMYDKSIERFEVVLAARDAQIHDDILKHGGYDYRLSEGGRNFSGGQRQRLEIARVLAQDPTIVILDEATSALDAKTEQEVVQAISERGITMIVVAHRLSTIRDCDEIIVLDRGEIVERGTHEELLKLNGHYTRLITTQ